MRYKRECPEGLREFGKCAVALLLSIFLAMASLLISAFAPQQRINDHLLTSAYGLGVEGLTPVISDRRSNSMLDNYTDVTMLRASGGTNRYYLGAILTNPIYTYEIETEEGEDYSIKCLQLYSMGERPDGQWLYPRYWMGFRAISRWLLVFLDYFQIRRYAGTLFFTLFALVFCSVSKNVDVKTAFAFAVSIILVRPQVIANCLQYLCCFLIAFSAMLLTPKLIKSPKWDVVFFFEIGIVTMFFDFYTVPIVTVGFPLVYLAVLRIRQGQQITIMWLIRCVLFWLGGYALMWLAKLTLTDLLTSTDGLRNGLWSFFGRVGIEKTEGLEEYYSVSMAFERIREAIFSDAEGKIIYLTGAGMIALTTCVCAIRRKIGWSTLMAHSCLLFVAVVPLIWFTVTAQPIAIHYMFQYRSIALTHWAVGAYLSATFWHSEEAKKKLLAGK